MSMTDQAVMGAHYHIGEDVTFGKNVEIRHNCIIEDHVTIGDDVLIEDNTIIRSGVTLGNGTIVGANCIIGEHQMDYYRGNRQVVHPLTIGEHALIRSGTIIYSGCTIGKNFQTGHQVTIREDSAIGDNVSLGTLCDVQGSCRIGNYVRLHSDVFVAPLSVIDDFVWIFPRAVLTNDPTPPSEEFAGVHICSFAIVASNAILLPGITIGRDALIGAGSVVTKDVNECAVMVGNPARHVTDVQKLKHKFTGAAAYPWRYYFSRAMPWDGMGFDAWYASLDLEEKQHHCLE